MNLKQFCRLPEVHSFDSNNAKLLIEDLSTKSLEDIPLQHRKRVEDFLTNELVHNSVEPGTIPSDLVLTLESLLRELQEAA